MREAEAMLFGVSFTARPGKEDELERLLSDATATRREVERMDAQGDALFVQGNRFTRIYRFADGVDAVVARARVIAALEAPEYRAFLRTIAPLLGDPYDPDDPTSVSAFVHRHKMRLVVEATRAPPSPPEAQPAPATHAPPRFRVLATSAQPAATPQPHA